jgi:hypothetical protein
MFVCSITLLIVSPQLRRALRSSYYYRRQQYSNENKSNKFLDIKNVEELLQLERESYF